MQARIGINMDGDAIDGRLRALENHIARAAELGYDAIEVSGYGASAVIDGRLHKAQVARVREITQRYPLHYTVHGPCELNLCLGEEGGMEERCLASYLEFCGEIGASVYVYHSGLVFLHEAYYGLSLLPGRARMEAAARKEVAALRRLAPRAAELGVTIAMENRDPHLWEVSTLARQGLGLDALTTYHPGLLVEEVIRQLEQVGQPNVGMTLDLGHLHIAAKTCGFDFLEAVSTAAPYVRHIHMHDNVGKLDGYAASQGERQSLGQGDMHMPPTWGSIPLREALQRLAAFSGTIIMELRPRYDDHWAEALATARGLVAGV